MTTEQREAALKLARGRYLTPQMIDYSTEYLFAAALLETDRLLAIAVKAIQDAKCERHHCDSLICFQCGEQLALCTSIRGPHNAKSRGPCNCWKARAVAQILPASNGAEPAAPGPSSPVNQNEGNK